LPAKSRKRRRRRRLNPTPILVLLLLANIGCGLAFSPITSAIKIRVFGAPDWDRDRIQQVLSSIQDRPWLSVQPEAAETELLTVGAVRSADLRRNLFGRGELHMAYRNAVATLSNPTNVALDGDGVMFTLHGPKPEVPVLTPPEGIWTNEMTMLGSWPVERLAQACVEASKLFPGQDVSVDASSPSGVCLNNVSGASVELGVADDKLPKKFEALRKMIARQPDLLATLSSLNISVPESPSSKPRKKEPNQ
jgi:cell division septal protein FtsQ